VLKNAESIARGRFNNLGRILTVLHMEKSMFVKARMFEDLDIVNKKINTTNNDVLLKSYDASMAALNEVAKPGSTTQVTINKAVAPIEVAALGHLDGSLIGNDMEKHAETLMLRAKEVYTNLLGPGDVAIADINLRLAHCYWHQQKLHVVRPLLQDALNIYQKSEPANSKKLVIAYLKLGELDRDLNQYANAKGELEQAVQSAQKYFSKDTNLNYECLNAYGCYLDETGKKQEGKDAFERAAKLNPKDLSEE
jgi:tetratricopeptide (TPR) repeat protein